jgi:hypothetical protein
VDRDCGKKLFLPRKLQQFPAIISKIKGLQKLDALVFLFFYSDLLGFTRIWSDFRTVLTEWVLGVKSAGTVLWPTGHRREPQFVSLFPFVLSHLLLLFAL